MRQIVLTFFFGVVRIRAVAWFFVVAFFGWGGFGIGVGRTNFKIGLGVASGIVRAGWANFEIGTPDPRYRWPKNQSWTCGPPDPRPCEIEVL